jgi:hypothetical protein
LFGCGWGGGGWLENQKLSTTKGPRGRKKRKEIQEIQECVFVGCAWPEDQQFFTANEAKVHRGRKEGRSKVRIRRQGIFEKTFTNGE